MLIHAYSTALKALVDEYKPKFAAVGVTIEFFDKTGPYDYTVKTPVSAHYVSGVHMPVIGFTLEKGGAGGAAPVVPVQIE